MPLTHPDDWETSRRAGHGTGVGDVMKIRYVGPNVAVQIAATGQWAEHGETVEVDVKVARELVKQDTWEKVTTKEKDDG